jgi:hypothetical protein
MRDAQRLTDIAEANTARFQSHNPLFPQRRRSSPREVRRVAQSVSSLISVSLAPQFERVFAQSQRHQSLPFERSAILAKHNAWRIPCPPARLAAIRIRLE